MRELTGWLTVLALLAAAGCGGCKDATVDTEAGSPAPNVVAAAEAGVQPLFTIGRSTNANVVHYDARLTPEGELDPEQPVIAYWIMSADDGRREDLTWLERRKAYGFDVEPAPSGEGYLMTLVSVPDREITVMKQAGTVRAELVIGGSRSVLEKVYIQSSAGWLGPDVQYVELLGKDLETGAERVEKIVP